MKVELTIDNDSELRQYVKELISGQVKSIVREEVKDIIQDVLFKKIQNTNIPNIEFITRQEISKRVDSELKSPAYGIPSFIKAEARQIINDYIKKALRENNILM